MNESMVFHFTNGKLDSDNGVYQAKLVNCTYQDKVENEDGVIKIVPKINQVSNELKLKDKLDKKLIGGKNRLPGLKVMQSYIVVNMENKVFASSAFTISMRFYINENTATTMMLFQGGSIPLQIMLQKTAANYSIQTQIKLNRCWKTCRTDEFIKPNTWYTVSVVFTGEEILTILSGKVIARRSFIDMEYEDGELNSPYYIGIASDQKSKQFIGMISSFSVYDRVQEQLLPLVEKAEQQGFMAIDSKYQDMVEKGNSPGKSVSIEKTLIASDKKTVVGLYRQYESGYIFWSYDSGTHYIPDAIYEKYATEGGATGKAGFPVEDAVEENGNIKCFFENGCIIYSTKTGAVFLQGEILVTYILLGAENSKLGLVTKEPYSIYSGLCLECQNGLMFYSETTGVHIVADQFYTYYKNCSKEMKARLGLPVTDLEKRFTQKREQYEIQTFESGVLFGQSVCPIIYISKDIWQKYLQLGGPDGTLGFPGMKSCGTNKISNGNKSAEYCDFSNGVIFQQEGSREAFAITDLVLRLGQVRSGKIDDGWNDKSAELVVYLTVKENGNPVTIDGKKMDDYRLNGHSGTSYNIGKQYTFKKIQGKSSFYFKVKTDDWDQTNSNDYLGSFIYQFDIFNMWGMDFVEKKTASDGSFAGTVNLTEAGGSSNRNLTAITLDYSISGVYKPKPNASFREEKWWSFHNFSGPDSLNYETYSSTFKDVNYIQGKWWEKLFNPMDYLFYKAVEGCCKKGNCFGMSLLGMEAFFNKSVYALPIYRYNLTDSLKHLINCKHMYQYGLSNFRHTVNAALSADMWNPKKVFWSVKRETDAGRVSIVSVHNISKGVGHSMMAYKCEENVKTGTCRIYLADPNVPYAKGETVKDPTYLEIYQNTNTFAYCITDGNGVVKESDEFNTKKFGQAAVAIVDTPFGLVSKEPHTPSAYVIGLALTAIFQLPRFLFNFIMTLVSGDAECEQVSAGSQQLFDYTTGQKNVKDITQGDKKLLYLPFGYDEDSRNQTLVLATGFEKEELVFKMKGTRTGTYTQRCMASDKEIEVTAPIKASETDEIHIKKTDSNMAELSIKTLGNVKQVKVAYTVKRANKGLQDVKYEVELPVGKKASKMYLNKLTGDLNISLNNKNEKVTVTRTVTLNGKKKISNITAQSTDAFQEIRFGGFTQVGTSKLGVNIALMSRKTGKISNLTRKEITQTIK